MNPLIPVRDCFFCKKPTCEIQFKLGIAHKKRYNEYIDKKYNKGKNKNG